MPDAETAMARLRELEIRGARPEVVLDDVSWRMISCVSDRLRRHSDLVISFARDPHLPLETCRRGMTTAEALLHVTTTTVVVVTAELPAGTALLLVTMTGEVMGTIAGTGRHLAGTNTEGTIEGTTTDGTGLHQGGTSTGGMIATVRLLGEIATETMEGWS